MLQEQFVSVNGYLLAFPWLVHIGGLIVIEIGACRLLKTHHVFREAFSALTEVVSLEVFGAVRNISNFLSAKEHSNGYTCLDNILPIFIFVFTLTRSFLT